MTRGKKSLGYQVQEETGSHPDGPSAFKLNYTKPYKNSMKLIHCNLVALLYEKEVIHLFSLLKNLPQP